MKIIVGNWKMNGDLKLSNDFIETLNAIETDNEIVICPPTALLGYFHDFKFALGAQNCAYAEKGAFTGECSPVLLREIGCKYVLVGHSERRKLFAESNDVVFSKWMAAVRQGVTPIVCVGESDKEDWVNELSRQLCGFIDQDLKGTIIAYEPVWCIGTGISPLPQQIYQSIEFIRKILTPTKILYGGSVNLKNYQEILQIPNVDGVLIGAASLDLDVFKTIAQFQVKR